jgi:single-strand selective monofunctional uracil DNA glycosylase
MSTLKTITDDLIADLDGLTFGPPVTHVYNPLLYARGPWDQYCERFGQGPREVLLVGMNPGPPGMSIPYEAGVA